VASGFGLLPFAAPPRVAQVGFLWTGSPASNYLFAAFRNGLRDDGWVEGQNLDTEIRAYEGRPELLQEMAAELVTLKPDVLATGTTAQALALRRATDSIPIVFALANDPVGGGLIASFARPGGNIAGTRTSAGPSMGPKKLGLLRQLVPGLERVAVVFGAGYPADVADLRDIQVAAQANGVDVQTVGIVSLGDRERDLAAALAGQPQALIIQGGGTFPPEHRQAIVAFANHASKRTAFAHYCRMAARLAANGGMLSWASHAQTDGSTGRIVNLTIERRAAERHADRLPAPASELAELPLAEVGQTSLAAKHATPTMPLVLAAVGDPVDLGVVTNLYDKANRALTSTYTAAQCAAETLDLHLLEFDVQTSEDVASAFASITGSGAEEILVISQPSYADAVGSHTAEFAAERRIPAMYGAKHCVQAGGLMGYGASLPAIFPKTATYIDRVLRRVNPNNVQNSQPPSTFVVNVRLAQTLGITFPRDVAAQVMELVQ
jgi:ABC-type uncharacterized transport system substrate-binding protein